MAGDVIASISAAITWGKELKKLSDKIDEIQFKTLISGLLNDLADAKINAADLKEQNLRLQAEVTDLQQKLGRKDGPRPEMKWGCYVFPKDETLYCPACYENKGKKIPTARLIRHHRKCPSCGALLG
jgi:hypothetical protein